MDRLNKNPLVTFALFAYKQEDFIREAVEAALAQTYEPLEIILSDDCSPDRTFEIMQEVVSSYVGPHRIVLNSNPVNLGSRGIGLHVNHVLEMAHGDFVLFSAGDDVSLPQRTKTLVDSWVAAGRPSGSIHSAVETLAINPKASGFVVQGNSRFAGQTIVDCIRTGAKGVLGASHAITRDLFKRFGPLPEGTLFEDRTLVFRSLLAGTVIYCPQVLVKYRQHGDNLTGSEMYSDEGRWSRWVDGTVAKYLSFLADYKEFMADKLLDPAVVREINRGIQRAERSRALVSGNSFGRAMAAFYYSSDFSASNRLAFIFQRAGLEDTALYKILSAIWKLSRRFSLLKARNF